MVSGTRETTRVPAQAGRFYEEEPRALRQTIDRLLAEAPTTSFQKTPTALLAPHAGYVYSGHVAAAAYRTVQGRTFDRVMILAPTHYEQFTGAALAPYRAFQTPLGSVPVDQKAVRELADAPHFEISEAAHAQEHAIEVELPFLQVALAGPFHILPITLGELPPGGLEPMVETLAGLLDQRRAQCQRWLVVASSDTYHGYDREACRENDERLMQLLQGMDVEELVRASCTSEVMACGWKALAIAMMLARRCGARECRILDHRDSADAMGVSPEREIRSRQYVVGYIGAAFQ